jgi:hypothetical protein
MMQLASLVDAANTDVPIWDEGEKVGDEGQPTGPEMAERIAKHLSRGAGAPGEGA